MNNDKTVKAGPTMIQVLLVIFIVLKLTGNIDWSWWWVLSPLWIMASGFILLFTLAVVLKIFSKE